MKYEDARPLFQDGDAVILPHNKFRSFYDFKIWLIKFFDTTPYTHVAMIKKFGDRLWVVESVRPFVRIGTLSSMLDQGGFWWINLNHPATEAETEDVLADVNVQQYSQIRAVLGKLGFIKKNKIGTARFVSCAEWFMSERAISGMEFNCDPTPSALVHYLADVRDFPMRYIEP